MKKRVISDLQVQIATSIYREKQGMDPIVVNPVEPKKLDPRIEKIKTLTAEISSELGIMKEAAVAAAVNLVLFDDMHPRRYS
jgi:hypothetical protein